MWSGGDKFFPFLFIFFPFRTESVIPPPPDQSDCRCEVCIQASWVLFMCYFLLFSYSFRILFLTCWLWYVLGQTWLGWIFLVSFDLPLPGQLCLALGWKVLCHYVFEISSASLAFSWMSITRILALSILSPISSLLLILFSFFSSNCVYSSSLSSSSLIFLNSVPSILLMPSIVFLFHLVHLQWKDFCLILFNYFHISIKSRLEYWTFSLFSLEFHWVSPKHLFWNLQAFGNFTSQVVAS